MLLFISQDDEGVLQKVEKAMEPYGENIKFNKIENEMHAKTVKRAEH